jgi:hypothetical protein
MLSDVEGSKHFPRRSIAEITLFSYHVPETGKILLHLCKVHYITKDKKETMPRRRGGNAHKNWGTCKQAYWGTSMYTYIRICTLYTSKKVVAHAVRTDL